MGGGGSRGISRSRNEMNSLVGMLGFRLPIIQAPMGGANATPPELVAAVSNAGGLGFIGAAYMSPDQISDACRRARELTSRPFGVNLFASVAAPGAPTDFSRALAALAPYHEELELPAPSPPEFPTFGFDDQLEATIGGGANVFSFTFGALPAPTIARVRRTGLYVMGTATTVAEARALEETGVVRSSCTGGGRRNRRRRPSEGVHHRIEKTRCVRRGRRMLNVATGRLSSTASSASAWSPICP